MGSQAHLRVSGRRDLGLSWAPSTSSTGRRSSSRPEFDFARYAELVGIRGIRVDAPEQVRPAWEEALAHPGPVLVEALTDPKMPRLPPQLRFETLRNMTRAFVKGDPAAADILLHTIRARRADLKAR